jgi:hypothetical protein
MTKEAWREHYWLKQATEKVCYYPALALIYEFIEIHNIEAKRHMNVWNPPYLRFTLDGILVEFKWNYKGKRRYTSLIQ